MSQTLQIGIVLQNRYRITRKIGEGGMGTVHEAIHITLHNLYAIKEIGESFSRDPMFLKHFEREAMLLSQLDHPCLPKVTDHFTENGRTFLVMQYITGEDLCEKLRRNNNLPFSVQVVMQWAEQLLGTLQYLHTQTPAVIHRDIKPSNLKLSENGRLYLLDFGLAKGITPPTAPTTSKSLLAATPHYSSPEQEAGERTDARSDLYSVGATLFNLLTGAIPETATKRQHLVSNHTPDPVSPPHLFNPQIPIQISNLIYRAMHLQPAQRPQTAEVMLKSLREILQNHDLQTTPDPRRRLATELVHSKKPPPTMVMGAGSASKHPTLIRNLALVTVFLVAVMAIGLSWTLGLFNVKLSPERQTGVPPTVPPTKVELAKTRSADLGNNVKMDFALIPAGDFMMGAPMGEDGFMKDQALHQASIPKPFYLGIAEVTQEQWEAIKHANPSLSARGAKHPVDNVSYDDCLDFVGRLNQQSGKMLYRLPTTTEWEYACRAGTTSPFHTGETISTEQANFDGTQPFGKSPKGNLFGKTRPVASFKPNAWGLFDMHGNVWEWCSDTHEGKPFIRGGSWQTPARYCRSAFNDFEDAKARKPTFGFRLVRMID